MAITDEIKKDYQYCFWRVYMKRRLATPIGAQYYETDWVEITDYVLEITPIVWNVDDVELNEFTQGGFTLTCDNKMQKFSPSSYTGSFFYGYLTRHKTKIKIVAGYIDRETDTEYAYDVGAGFINADEISIESDSMIMIPCLAPSMVFDENPADDVNEGIGINIDWYDNALISVVVGHVYNLQKGADPIFHPYLDGADIAPANDVVADLYNFSDWSCRTALTKMAQVSNSVHYVAADWRLKFKTRTPPGGSAFTFSNTGSEVNILEAWGYNDGLNKLLTRVAWYQTDPPIVAEEAWAVGDSSNTWKYGRRAYSVDNRLVTTTAVRQSIVDAIYAEYGSIKQSIFLRTKFVPQLILLDKVTVNYYGVYAKHPPTFWGKSWWKKGVWHGRIGSIVITALDMKIRRLEHNLMDFTSTVQLREI